VIDPDFLTLADVIEIHDDQIRRYGGSQSIRDIGLLDSAVVMAQASFAGQYLHPALYEMAAAYAYHISENQPFVDGNKRTGLAAALTFLKLNGIAIEDRQGKLHRVMMNVGIGQLSKKELAQIFEESGEAGR
jgi:death-on-curing protein